jgi:hypothetical protein
MSMLETTEIDLMISDELLPKINCKIDSVSCLIDFLLEDVIEADLRFTLYFDFFLKFLHLNSSILAELNEIVVRYLLDICDLNI